MSQSPTERLYISCQRVSFVADNTQPNNELTNKRLARALKFNDDWLCERARASRRYLVPLKLRKRRANFGGPVHAPQYGRRSR